MKFRNFCTIVFWLLFFPAPLSHAATATYTYDALNRVIQETYANGLVIDYTYDAVGNRLTSHTYMQSFQITVDTTPSGLQITADGVTSTAPQVFTWAAQSTHTVNTTSPQSGSPGVQYLFNTWSDGGAQSHPITTPAANTTYAASFLTQNLLTMSLTTAGSGTITPTPAGAVTTCPQYLCEWYASGASVTLTPAPANGNFFSSWSGDCTGSGACVVTLNAPRSVTTTFLPFILQTRLPTSTTTLQSPWAGTGTGCTTTATAYLCVNDPIGSPNNSTNYIRDNNNSGKQAIFGFLPVFAVPAGSTIVYVRVTYVAIANTTSATNIKAALRVGTTVYSPTAAQTLSQGWTNATYTTDWTTNPGTSAAWTIDDVNGTGSHPLLGFGVVSGTGDESVTQIYVTAAYADTTPPTISSVAAGSITSSGATITWTTNEPSDSQVEYGTTTSYGSSTTLNPTLVTSHSQALTGLSSGTLYHYRVKSRDAASNLATGTDATFGTTAILTVTKAGTATGLGTVTSSPAGINCGSTCSANFVYGAVVTLTPSAGAGSSFAGWSGAGCSGTGTCVITMSANTAVTATFNDTVAPANTTAANFISSGAASTAATAVTLAIAGTDAVGVTGYYASESATAPLAGATGWVAVTSTTAYSASVPFTLSAGDATKTVYVWFKDAVGNVSAAVSDPIILDTIAPVNTTGANFISGGAASTPTTAVTLAIAATDAVGVTGYYASESATAPLAGATGWVAVTSTTSYAATVNFTLSTGNGTKTVYVWMKDAAGNVSSTGVSDTITLSVASTQDRLPTSKINVISPWSTTGCNNSSAYQCVDDPIGSPNNSTDYIRDNNSSGKEATFGFLPVFTVPTGSTIQYVRVTHVTIRNSGSSADIKAALRVGGTTYTQAAAQTLNGSWTTYSYDWTTNPRTGAAWIVEDVNGTGSNPLQGMGVYSGSGDESVTQVYVTVGYQ
jgi:YD repeat-containing protein